MPRSIRRLVLVLLVLAAPFVWSVTTWEPPAVPTGAPQGTATTGRDLAQPERPGGPGADGRRGHAEPPAFLGVVTGPTEAVVTGVMPASPAEAAGLRIGDALRSIDGKPVRTAADLQRLLASARVGDRIVIRFTRGDELYETGATLVGAPGARRQRSVPR